VSEAHLSESIQELATMLVDDPEIASREWDHLAVVATVSKGSSKASGFAYLHNGKAVPTGPANFEFLKKVEELRRAMHEPGKEPWQAMLIRVDSSSGKFTADFEYERPDKWRISPANVREMAETLRPK
jgi:hypothetical protein